ncbi:MAG: MBL fold metallo-hydrolase [Alphaproteobacteria bacterium]
MFLEKVKTPGLAHLSYVLGEGGVAAVIDPRRDWQVYVDIATANDCRIGHVFETHRNEDLVSGAPLLARATGAAVHHGPNADGEVRYADTVRDGDLFRFGKIELRVLETPGHTDDSLSFAIFDSAFDDGAVGVFTGDALFVGDVGRTDFYPDRAEEVAGLLYDSLRKLLALGDQALVYPAHGAGSVCGDNMADREFSSLGHERRNNPMLAIDDRDAFIARKLAEHHDQPPYFRLMEHLNLVGGEAPPPVLAPAPLTPEDLKQAQGSTLVDVRGVTAYLGGHLPGSLALPADMVSAFAGWLLESDDDIVLVADGEAQATDVARQLARIGYDEVRGRLIPALPGWASGARPFRSMPVVDVAEVATRVAERPNGWTLLDVRKQPEVEQGVVEGAEHIFIGDLPDRLDSLPRDRHHTVMCASGARATIAASVLSRAGFEKVDVFLGSMGAWKAAGHPTVELSG